MKILREEYKTEFMAESTAKHFLSHKALAFGPDTTKHLCYFYLELFYELGSQTNLQLDKRQCSNRAESQMALGCSATVEASKKNPQRETLTK